jgi:hypothetical protein
MRNPPSLAPKHSEAAQAQEVVASVSKDAFASFISGHPYTVIWADEGAKKNSFPAGLALHLGLFHVPTVRFGVVDLSTIEWTDAVQLYTLLNLERLQMKPDDQGRPPAGYYLFARGIPLGFHPGKIDLDKDQTALGWGMLAGFLGLITESKEISHVGMQISTWQVSERIAKEFIRLIAGHAKHASGSGGTLPPAMKPDAEEVLRRAHATLGLSASASNEEITAAHERLLKALQLRGHEPEELMRRVAELHAAKEFILAHRASK